MTKPIDIKQHIFNKAVQRSTQTETQSTGPELINLCKIYKERKEQLSKVQTDSSNEEN